MAGEEVLKRILKARLKAGEDPAKIFNAPIFNSLSQDKKNLFYMTAMNELKKEGVPKKAREKVYCNTISIKIPLYLKKNLERWEEYWKDDYNLGKSKVVREALEKFLKPEFEKYNLTWLSSNAEGGELNDN